MSRYASLCLLSAALVVSTLGQPPRGGPPSAATGVHSDAPEAGSMLVASRWLDDTNFGESVVLLLEVGDAGAMGVIVNRPTSTTVAAALPQLPMFAGRDERLFAGGPVSATQPLFLAASSPSAADARELVADEVFLLTEQDSIALALETGAVRVLLGYAGWGPGQLEAELARSAWHLVPGSGRWVFAEDSLGLWQKLLDVIFLPTA